MLKKKTVGNLLWYIKKYGKRYCPLFVLFSGMMVVQIFSFYLCGMETEDIQYFVFLEIILFLGMAGITFFQFYRKLKETKKKIDGYTKEMCALPETEDALEELYIEALELLQGERKQEESAYRSSQQEMKEYYALWVHQIKTPIAAMKLLLQAKKNQLSNQLLQLADNLPDEEETTEPSSRECIKEQSQEIQKEKNFVEEKTTKLSLQENLMQQIETEKERIADMEQELFWMEQYVQMALQYQRMASKSHDFVLERVSLDTVVRAAIRKFAKVMIHRKIVVNYEGCKETVISDAKWLGFVVEQLLSNAIKYSRGNSAILIKLNKAEENQPDHAGAKTFQLVISDQGIGIRKEDLPRIFEKGYTGYNGRADQTSTGIGLYLCREITNKLGHEIQIDSEVGKGTEAVIVFHSMKLDHRD